MTADDPDFPDHEPHRLVCGRCREALEGTHATKAKADQAADAHIPQHHADTHATIVLAVPASFLESHHDTVLALATHAQQRVDQRQQDDQDA